MIDWSHVYRVCILMAEFNMPTHYHSRIDGAVLPWGPTA